LSFCIDLIMVGEIRRASSSMPARIFRALSIIAEDAVRSADALPVTSLPSGSSAQTAGLSDSEASLLTVTTAFLLSGDIPALFIRASTRRTSSSSARPSLRSLKTPKYLLEISFRDASHTAASSVMQFPAMLTPMSVGDLYGDSP